MGSIPDWPGYVVKMIRDVVLGRRVVGEAGGFIPPSGDSDGGEDAAFPSSMGSNDGESLMLPRCDGRNADRVFCVSTLADKESTLAARLAWSTCIRLRVDRISDNTASLPAPLAVGVVMLMWCWFLRGHSLRYFCTQIANQIS
jgi:hypothetical protein